MSAFEGHAGITAMSERTHELLHTARVHLARKLERQARELEQQIDQAQNPPAQEKPAESVRSIVQGWISRLNPARERVS